MNRTRTTLTFSQPPARRNDASYEVLVNGLIQHGCARRRGREGIRVALPPDRSACRGRVDCRLCSATARAGRKSVNRHASFLVHRVAACAYPRYVGFATSAGRAIGSARTPGHPGTAPCGASGSQRAPATGSPGISSRDWAQGAYSRWRRQ